MMLQIAIEQSLRESVGAEDTRTQEQIMADLEQMQSFVAVPAANSAETEYFRAIRDSQVEADRRRREEEQFEEQLRQVLELSKHEQ